jgi:amidase
MDVLGGLSRGVNGIRIGVVREGFDGAEPDVRDTVLTAIETLARAGAEIEDVSIPEHGAASSVAAVLWGEGSLAIFNTGLFGSFTKTYYPASLIAAINKMWANQAGLLAPRIKFRYLLGELSRLNYHGRVYAKVQNVRNSFVTAYDTALQHVDVLAMPTTVMKAPKATMSSSYLEEVETDLELPGRNFTRNTHPFSYTGHPSLALPCGKSQGLPVSVQLTGRFFDDPLLLRVGYAYQHSVDWDRLTAIEQ